MAILSPFLKSFFKSWIDCICLEAGPGHNREIISGLGTPWCAPRWAAGGGWGEVGRLCLSCRKDETDPLWTCARKANLANEIYTCNGSWVLSNTNKYYNFSQKAWKIFFFLIFKRLNFQKIAIQFAAVQPSGLCCHPSFSSSAAPNISELYASIFFDWGPLTKNSPHIKLLCHHDHTWL